MTTAWKTKPLGEIFDVVGGGTPSKKKPAYYGGNIPWATIRDMHSATLTQTEHTITDQGLQASSAKLIPAGEVIMASRVGLGKACLIHQDTAINQDIRALIPRDTDAIDRRFCLYWLQTQVDAIIDAGSGATVQGIKLPFIKSLPFPDISMKQQKRVVTVLDKAFAALDRARANAEANLADSEDLFANWLAIIFERQGREWEQVRLPDISENLDRQRVPITKSDRVAGSVPYYGASGVVDHVADYIFDEDLLLISEDGANLLARTYPIAFSISGKSWVNNHAHVLRFEDRTDQEFVRLYLESLSLQPFISGMAQPKLNQKALNKIPIPFPDVAIRQDIVEEAERIAVLTTRAVTQYEKALKDINDLRLSILSTAFAGRL